MANQATDAEQAIEEAGGPATLYPPMLARALTRHSRTFVTGSIRTKRLTIHVVETTKGYDEESTDYQGGQSWTRHWGVDDRNQWWTVSEYSKDTTWMIDAGRSEESGSADWGTRGTRYGYFGPGRVGPGRPVSWWAYPVADRSRNVGAPTSCGSSLSEGTRCSS